MSTNMLERGQIALNQVAQEHLPIVVRWLELLALTKDHPDVEPEELWLLASGDLKQMNDEVDQAKPIDDWRKYLDEI